MRRETALDRVETLAFEAVEKMAEKIAAEELPLSALYFKALKDCHSMLSNGLRSNPLDEGDMEPEELLARLNEMAERVRKRLARKRELEQETRAAEVMAAEREEARRMELDS